MAGSSYLIDSNILIRWVQRDDPDYRVVESALNVLAKQEEILCYTSQNLAEFWNACTRPINRNGYGLTPQETDRRARLFESRLRILQDGLPVHQEWRKLLLAYNVSGAQVHDARLVASMLVHGVKRILTFNDQDFIRYKSIEAIHPRTVLAESP